MNSIKIQDMLFDCLITPEQIDSIEQKVADQINFDYRDKELLCIGVLNGAALFTAGLFKRLTMITELSFVRLNSYEGEQTTGKVTEIIPLQVDVKGRDVLLLEDIVDTGTSMHFYKQMLLDKGAASVKVAALVTKPEKLLYPDAKPDYIGQEVPNLFLVGYGLDYDENYRNLPAIYAKRP